jgi:hypothetical protein
MKMKIEWKDGIPVVTSKELALFIGKVHSAITQLVKRLAVSEGFRRQNFIFVDYGRSQSHYCLTKAGVERVIRHLRVPEDKKVEMIAEANSAWDDDNDAPVKRKTCVICRDSFRLHRGNFEIDLKTKDGYAVVCKRCSEKYSKDEPAKVVPEPFNPPRTFCSNTPPPVELQEPVKQQLPAPLFFWDTVLNEIAKMDGSEIVSFLMDVSRACVEEVLTRPSMSKGGA